jgi:hypothetical protein
VIAVVAVLLLRSGGGGGTTTHTIASARFCALAYAVDDSVADGAGSAPGRFDGSPDAIRATAQRLLPSLDELLRSSPGSLQGDTKTIVADLRSAAQGNVSSVQSADFKSTYQSWSNHRSRSCGSPGGDTSGEG